MYEAFRAHCSVTGGCSLSGELLYRPVAHGNPPRMKGHEFESGIRIPPTSEKQIQVLVWPDRLRGETVRARSVFYFTSKSAVVKEELDYKRG